MLETILTTSADAKSQLRRRFYVFYVGKILRKAMLGFLEKLSKWFHGPADLGEPSGPEQKESYNTSIDQFLDSKNYLLYLLGIQVKEWNC